MGVREPELSESGHADGCWPYVAAWVAGRRVKGLLFCSKKGLVLLLVEVRSAKGPVGKSSQRDVSGENMPWVLLVGDMMLGVSKMLESKVTLSSKEKVDGLRSTERVEEGRWKSICCE